MSVLHTLAGSPASYILKLQMIWKSKMEFWRGGFHHGGC